MYDAATLHLHCSSKPFSNDGSAYPSQTSRFKVGVFFAHDPQTPTSTQSANSQAHRLTIISSPPQLELRSTPATRRPPCHPPSSSEPESFQSPMARSQTDPATARSGPRACPLPAILPTPLDVLQTRPQAYTRESRLLDGCAR